MKLLCLCDDPTLQTGFGRVASNLLSRWHTSGYFDGGIDVYAIGYQGWPHDGVPYRFFPAVPTQKGVWWDRANLQFFINQAVAGGYTHVWMMHDPVNLRPLAEPMENLRQIRGVATFGYFPVDAPVDRDWVRIAAAMTVPVAYTDYGRDALVDAYRDYQIHGGRDPHTDRDVERLRPDSHQLAVRVAAFRDRLRILPHGIDAHTYWPLPAEGRRQMRARLFAGRVAADDFLIVSVNSHQRRKGHFQTLATFAELRRQCPDYPWRLYLHCPRENPGEKTDLGVQAEVLGLPPGSVWFGDEHFGGTYQPAASEDTLRNIYNCADLFISCSHGEGWGLTVTEAMACGVPVAAPFHTALGDLLAHGRAIELPVATQVILPGDWNRPRPVVDPVAAAAQILESIGGHAYGDGTYPNYLPDLAEAGRRFMSRPEFDWDRIAAAWLDLFQTHASAPAHSAA